MKKVMHVAWLSLVLALLCAAPVLAGGEPSFGDKSNPASSPGGASKTEISPLDNADVPVTPAMQQEVEKINQDIKAKGAKWQAGVTSMIKLSPELRQQLIGGLLPTAAERRKLKQHHPDLPLPAMDAPEEQLGASYSTTGQTQYTAAPAGVIQPLATASALPAGLDYRNYNGGNFVTAVRNQGGCGSCWAFASTATLESRMLLGLNMPNADLDLSEQIVVSCSGSGTCSGGGLVTSYFVNTGLPLEPYFPYLATDLACSSALPGWETDTFKISGSVGFYPASLDELKNALNTYGPISVNMIVWKDFLAYSSGIYMHGTADATGLHAVSLIGYDDNLQNPDQGGYFIIKNSWGTGWGEQGFARVSYAMFNPLSYDFAYTAMAYTGAVYGDSGSIITTPHDHTDLQAGTTYTVTGIAAPNQPAAITGISVSADGGATWLPAADLSGNGSWSSWSYQWNVPAPGVYTLQSQITYSDGSQETPKPAITVISKQGYTVTPAPGANGSMTPATPQTVLDGYSINFTVTPDPGYATASVSGCNGTLIGTTYYIYYVTADCTVSATFVVANASDPVLNPASCPPAALNIPYTCSFSGSGGNAPYTFAFVNWSFSPGMYGHSNGVDFSFGGTPTAFGTSTFGLKMTDSAGKSVTQNYSIPVLPSFTITPTAGTGGSISPAAPQTIAQGQSASFTVTPNSGYRIDAVTGCGGALLGNTYMTGQIMADCAVSATFVIKATHTVTPAAGAGGSISPSTPQTVDDGSATTFTVTPNAGYHIGSVAGCGGTLNGSTYITGPITADCTVSATFAVSTYTVTPSAGTGGSISPSTAQTVNFNQTAIFTVTPNSGYLINSVTGCGGTLNGTTYTTVPVTASCTVSATFRASVPLSITTTTLADGYRSTAYTQTLAATGGNTPYSWSIMSGSLQSGLTFTNGVISGTPTSSGTSSVTFQVRDANNTTATKGLAMTVYALPSVSTSSLPTGTVGTSYSRTLSGTGGKTPYTWSLGSGSLPAGLTLSAGGTISGTPTSSGSSSFMVQVADANSKTATRGLSITITSGGSSLSVATASLSDGYRSTAYTQTLAATGGRTPYSWSITSGTLQSGLTLSTNGVISGTPTSSGTSSVTFQVRDANNTTATKGLALTVYALPTVSSSSLPTGTVGTMYNRTLAATGGKTPYTWSLSSGSLPAGLSLSTGGTITGNPTSAGTTSFTVRVSDANNKTATKGLSITIASGASGVSALNVWSNITSTVPNTTSVANLPAGSFAVGSGTNRLLLVSVIMEVGTASNPTITASYGGTPLTQVKVTNNTQREIVWVGYLKDSQIGTGTKPLSVSYSGASGNASALHVKWSAFSGVNQTTPVLSSAATNTAATSATFGSTVNYANGGMTTVVTGNGGTPASASINNAAFTAGTTGTTNAQSSTTFTTARHTASGSFGSSTAVSWNGTTSSRTGLVVVSLQP